MQMARYGSNAAVAEMFHSMTLPKIGDKIGGITSPPAAETTWYAIRTSGGVGRLLSAWGVLSRFTFSLVQGAVP